MMSGWRRMSAARRALVVVALTLVAGASLWLAVTIVRDLEGYWWPVGLAFVAASALLALARSPRRSRRERDLDEVVEREFGNDAGHEGGEPR